MLILNDYESSFYDILSTLNENSPTLHKRFINRSTLLSRQPLPGIDE